MHHHFFAAIKFAYKFGLIGIVAKLTRKSHTKIICTTIQILRTFHHRGGSKTCYYCHYFPFLHATVVLFPDVEDSFSFVCDFGR